MNHSHTMTNPAEIGIFTLAGKATLTLRSQRTEARYTYRAQVANNNPNLFFVGYLTGPDNTNDFTDLGVMRRTLNGIEFSLTRKSKLTDASVPVKAYRYFVTQVINQHRVPDSLEIRHEGRCGRCHRALTVPESIDRGIGPECANIMGLAA